MKANYGKNSNNTYDFKQYWNTIKTLEPNSKVMCVFDPCNQTDLTEEQALDYACSYIPTNKDFWRATISTTLTMLKDDGSWIWPNAGWTVSKKKNGLFDIKVN